MKIIYLHDPKVVASVLPQLEETFPMLEIIAIDLEDDFEKQFDQSTVLSIYNSKKPQIRHYHRWIRHNLCIIFHSNTGKRANVSHDNNIIESRLPCLKKYTHLKNFCKATQKSAT